MPLYILRDHDQRLFLSHPFKGRRVNIDDKINMWHMFTFLAVVSSVQTQKGELYVIFESLISRLLSCLGAFMVLLNVLSYCNVSC